MRKNNISHLWFAWMVFVAVVTTGVLLATSAAICFHDARKSNPMSEQKFLWQENMDEEDALDMSKILKKYLIRSL